MNSQFTHPIRRVSNITLINIRGTEQRILLLVHWSHGHVRVITRLITTAETHKNETMICNTRTTLYQKSVQIQLHFLKHLSLSAYHTSLFKRSPERSRFSTWSFSSTGSCCTSCWTCPFWKHQLRTCRNAPSCSSGSSAGLHNGRIERSGKWDLSIKWTCHNCCLIWTWRRSWHGRSTYLWLFTV